MQWLRVWEEWDGGDVPTGHDEGPTFDLHGYGVESSATFTRGEFTGRDGMIDAANMLGPFEWESRRGKSQPCPNL